jgi:hypothetical protein
VVVQRPPEIFLDELGPLVAILVSATGVSKSRGIGEAVGADRPELGQPEEAAMIFGDIARASPSGSSARKRTPRGTKATSPGAMSILPISVSSVSRPICGMNSISPSALKKQRRSMSRLAR